MKVQRNADEGITTKPIMATTTSTHAVGTMGHPTIALNSCPGVELSVH